MPKVHLSARDVDAATVPVKGEDRYPFHTKPARWWSPRSIVSTIGATTSPEPSMFHGVVPRPSPCPLRALACGKSRLVVG